MVAILENMWSMHVVTAHLVKPDCRLWQLHTHLGKNMPASQACTLTHAKLLTQPRVHVIIDDTLVVLGFVCCVTESKLQNVLLFLPFTVYIYKLLFTYISNKDKLHPLPKKSAKNSTRLTSYVLSDCDSECFDEETYYLNEKKYKPKINAIKYLKLCRG